MADDQVTGAADAASTGAEQGQTSASQTTVATEAQPVQTQVGDTVLAGNKEAEAKFLSLVGDKGLDEVNGLLQAGIDAKAKAAEPVVEEPEDALVDWAKRIAKPFESTDVAGAQAAINAHKEASQPPARM